MQINLRNAQKLIEKACSAKLARPDFKKYSECVKMWNSRPDMPGKTLKFVMRKMQDKNPKVQLLALELIDYGSNACDIPFHTQLASRDFLKVIQTLLLRRQNLANVVYNKLTFLSLFWHTLYAAPAKREIISSFADNYNFLKSKNVKFEPYKDSAYAKLRKYIYSRKYSQFIRKVEQKQQKIQQQVQSGLNKRISSYTKNKQSKSKDVPEEYKQLKKDLTVVNENIILINTIIDASDPKEDANSNGLLVDLVSTLQGMESRLHKLITELGEGEMMSFTLTLNDDLTATLSRYKDLMKGKKPEPFLAGGKLPWVVDPDQKSASPKKRKSPKKPKKVMSFEDFGDGNDDKGQEDDFMDFGNQNKREEQKQEQEVHEENDDMLDLLGGGDEPDPQPQQQHNNDDLLSGFGNPQPVQQLKVQQPQKIQQQNTMDLLGMNSNNNVQFNKQPQQNNQVNVGQLGQMYNTQQPQQPQKNQQMDKYSMMNLGGGMNVNQGGMNNQFQTQYQQQQPMQNYYMTQQPQFQQNYQQPQNQQMPNFQIQRAQPPMTGTVTMKQNPNLNFKPSPLPQFQKQKSEEDAFKDLDDMMGIMDIDDDDLC